MMDLADFLSERDVDRLFMRQHGPVTQHIGKGS
jgi:hypothetical protein